METSNPANAAAAFDLLSDPTRVAILQELAAADEPLGFTALRERAGVQDSGRFNYHLTRLRDRLVTHTDRGYELTDDGRRAAGLF